VRNSRRPAGRLPVRAFSSPGLILLRRETGRDVATDQIQGRADPLGVFREQSMRFRKVLALRGPNYWANFPVLEAWVDLEDLKDSPSDEIPGFNDRLKAWLPSMVEHQCSVGRRGGFFERLARGTYQAHILEHVSLELQCLVGTDVGFGRARETSEDGVYKVAIEFEEEELGLAALERGLELCLAAVHDRPFDVPAEVEALKALHRRVRLAPGPASIARAARKRNIPTRRLNAEGLLLLGQGARQRRVMGSLTDRTGAIAESVAGDPDLSRALLRSVGVPVPGDDSGPIGGQHRLLVVGDRVVAATRLDPNPSDVRDRVHPEVEALAADAARVIGLDVAGVEVAAEDIAQPLERQGGVVTSVVAAPDLSIHLEAAKARPVGEVIVDSLFEAGDDGRIPLIAVTGVNGKTTTTRLIAHILAGTGLRVAMTCTEGIYVDGRQIESGDCSGPRSAKAILANPTVEAAVLECARGGILREGLGFDRCDVAVVTNIGEGDHLGLSDIETLEKLARVKKTVVDVVARDEGHAVLNAADPLVSAMAEGCRGHVVFFARDPENPVLKAHRACRGKAAFVRDGSIVLSEGDREESLVLLTRVPLTFHGRVGFQVENALAAAAACWARGISTGIIRIGLETFRGDAIDAPGRFNVIHKHGATVIVDYGHNPSARAALVEALDLFPHERRVIVCSADGDRTEDSIVRQGEILGDGFDRVILYEDRNLRGRAEGEIFELLGRGLARGRRVGSVEEIVGEEAAIARAIEDLAPGDLVVFQVDEDVHTTRSLVESGLSNIPGPEQAEARATRPAQELQPTT
jgi:cyanophycin synthetase